MASLWNALFGKKSESNTIVGQAASLHEVTPRKLEAEVSKVAEKRVVRPLIDIHVNNWSRRVELPLLEVAILGNGSDELKIAGRTHLYAAQEIRNNSRNQPMTDSSFRTMDNFRERFTIQVVASKEEDGAIPGTYTDLMLFSMECHGATSEEIEKQREVNKVYQAEHRSQLLSQENVHSTHIRDITEPVTVYIDVQDKNAKHAEDFLTMTIVSKRTEKVIAQVEMEIK